MSVIGLIVSCVTLVVTVLIWLDVRKTGAKLGRGHWDD